MFEAVVTPAPCESFPVGGCTRQYLFYLNALGPHFLVGLIDTEWTQFPERE
jgi:hypothetical protein